MGGLATSGWPSDLLTLDDWVALGADERHHVECVEGVLLVAPNPHFRHQKAAVRLEVALERQLPANLATAVDLDVVLSLSPLTVRAPDVIVTRASAYETDPQRVTAAEVSLVVEIVSLGSRRTDRVTKLSEYAEAGIAAYWILEGDPFTLTAFALTGGGETYRLVGEFSGTVALDVAGTPVRIDLDGLTRR